MARPVTTQHNTTTIQPPILASLDLSPPVSQSLPKPPPILQAQPILAQPILPSPIVQPNTKASRSEISPPVRAALVRRQHVINSGHGVDAFMAHSSDSDLHKDYPQYIPRPYGRIYVDARIASIIIAEPGYGITPVVTDTTKLVQSILSLFARPDCVDKPGIASLKLGQFGHLGSSGFAYKTRCLLWPKVGSIDQQLVDLIPENLQFHLSERSVAIVRSLKGGHKIDAHIDSSSYDPCVGFCVIDSCACLDDKPALQFGPSKDKDTWSTTLAIPHQKGVINWFWGDMRHKLFHRVPVMPVNQNVQRLTVTFRLWAGSNEKWETE